MAISSCSDCSSNRSADALASVREHHQELMAKLREGRDQREQNIAAVAPAQATPAEGSSVNILA